MSQVENNNLTCDATHEVNRETVNELNELMQTKEQLIDEKQRLQQEINFYRQRIFCSENSTNSA